jgi:hypothetical protein
VDQRLFFDNTPDGWRNEQGISYAILNASETEVLRTAAEGQADAASMLHLRDFDAPSRGSTFSVYRLWRMQHETQYRFGDNILLLGFDQSAERAAAGETVTFRFYWQAAATPDDNYSLFIHLLTQGDAAPLAQADGAPARPERPTLSWNDPSETLISQPFALTIPAEVEAGSYRVMIGLYNYQTGKRLPVTDISSGELIGDAVPLVQIEVGG